jgi:hypothetical protein
MAHEVITAETFDSLKTGQRVRVAFSSCMACSDDAGVVLKVGRRSASKKYNVVTLALDPVDGRKVHAMSKLRLYKRASGNVSLALGDMATAVTRFEIV